MNKDNIICPECGTENEPQYTYCKNCGTKIATESSADKYQANDNFTGNEEKENGEYTNLIIDTIDGNSTDDIITFTGKNAMKFVPKFSKMELTGSRISWCWPVAVLGYLFGPLGASLWFFYRKMYKAALILLLIGTLVGGASAALNGYVNSVNQPERNEIVNEFLQGIDSFESIVSNYIEPPYSLPYAFVENFIGIATFLLGGLYSMNIYKKHVAQRISQFKNSDVDPRYYKLGLASIGGVSSGMTWLGGFLVVIITNGFDVISNIVAKFLIG